MFFDRNIIPKYNIRSLKFLPATKEPKKSYINDLHIFYIFN